VGDADGPNLRQIAARNGAPPGACRQAGWAWRNSSITFQEEPLFSLDERRIAGMIVIKPASTRPGEVRLPPSHQSRVRETNPRFAPRVESAVPCESTLAVQRAVVRAGHEGPQLGDDAALHVVEASIMPDWRGSWLRAWVRHVSSYPLRWIFRFDVQSPRLRSLPG